MMGKKYKIIMHVMPWEIDYLHLSFMQLRKSYYHLDSPNIEISTVLNLSSHIINWEESILPKEFFIQKYEDLQKIIAPINNKSKIYEGNKLYGHLDFQREEMDKETDYYIIMCPDMYFDEYLLYSMINASRQIKNKYFVLTPDISKMWDETWDEITNKKYKNIDYKNWNKIEIFDIIYNNNDIEDLSLVPIERNKWAGWFDLYSKELYEDVLTISENWHGYGPWDWYGMQLLEICKKQKIDFQQWLISGKTVFEYSVGSLEETGFSKYYKDFLTLNKIEDQREEFEKNMSLYLNENFKRLKEIGIL